ncbi:unnamed protein product [Prunus brigantina]
MKKAIALSFMLVLLFAISAGGVSCKEVTCYDKFDMSIGPEKSCNPNDCKVLCHSKYWQLYNATCFDWKTCKCAYSC